MSRYRTRGGQKKVLACSSIHATTLFGEKRFAMGVHLPVDDKTMEEVLALTPRAFTSHTYLGEVPVFFFIRKKGRPPQETSLSEWLVSRHPHTQTRPLPFFLVAGTGGGGTGGGSSQSSRHSLSYLGGLRSTIRFDWRGRKITNKCEDSSHK